MSLVQFASTGGVINYPDDIRFFKKAKYHESLGLVIGHYDGAMSLTPYLGDWPIVDPEYRTQLVLEEFIDLLGAVAFKKISKEAYPNGAAAGDELTLFHLGKIDAAFAREGSYDVQSALVDDALTYFELQSYIDAADKARIQQGVLV